MQVLALVGSPRREGNTAVLVQKILEGIKYKNKDAETELLFLNEMKIHPCQSCYSCLTSPGECVQDDDMRFIYKSLSKVNVLVIGTPIYMNYVSAQTKLCLDRLFPYAHKPTPPLHRRIKTVLVFTWGWNKRNAYDYVIEEVKKVLERREIKIVEVVKGVGFHYRKTEVLEQPHLLKKAFEVGRKLGVRLK